MRILFQELICSLALGEIYPYNFDQPLFHIHLNVDFPFKLTGVLYFPKISPSVDLNKNKIQLYCNQVFVTDSVEGVVPDFLGLLHGVIDSPDIPLNVSRSSLQSDSNVKKISSHISKKVSDKLNKMFKDDRKSFESKWNDMKLIVEYGMLSDEKFYDRSSEFFLYPNGNHGMSNNNFEVLEDIFVEYFKSPVEISDIIDVL